METVYPKEYCTDGAQMMHIKGPDTKFDGSACRTDFSIVRYSVTTSGLASSSKFPLQGNVDKICRFVTMVY
jgi:hypothetical protein